MAADQYAWILYHETHDDFQFEVSAKVPNLLAAGGDWASREVGRDEATILRDRAKEAGSKPR